MFSKLVCVALSAAAITVGVAGTASAKDGGPYSSLEQCERAAAAAWDGHCVSRNGYWYVVNK